MTHDVYILHIKVATRASVEQCQLHINKQTNKIYLLNAIVVRYWSIYGSGAMAVLRVLNSLQDL